MKDIVIDTLIDGVKLIPFLFIAFLIIELIEHKLSNRNKDLITKTGKFGPMFGSILGMFPQCGFSVLATNLYVTRIVSLGTLISIYLSTSDEMLPILLSENVEIGLIIKILLIKLFIGMISGFIIDFILRKKESKVETDYEICHEENCHCKEHLLLSVIKHTIHITLFLMIISFLLNCLWFRLKYLCFLYQDKFPVRQEIGFSAHWQEKELCSLFVFVPRKAFRKARLLIPMCLFFP